MFDYCRFDCLASVVWLGTVAEPMLFVCGLLSLLVVCELRWGLDWMLGCVGLLWWCVLFVMMLCGRYDACWCGFRWLLVFFRVFVVLVQGGTLWLCCFDLLLIAVGCLAPVVAGVFVLGLGIGLMVCLRVVLWR